MASSLRRKTSAAAAAALLQVEEQGLGFPDSPLSDLPELPEDITACADSTLMELFTQFTGWADYVGTQHALAVIDERDAERQLEIAEATAVTSTWSGTSADRVAIAKAKIALDPAVQTAKKTVQDRYAYRKLIETLFANLERDAALVSRELTRRTSFAPATRTRGNYTL